MIEIIIAIFAVMIILFVFSIFLVILSIAGAIMSDKIANDKNNRCSECNKKNN